MNSLKKGEPLPLLNFEGGPGILLLNFEGGPGVLLLNFRGVPGPTFKLWGGSRVPGPRVPRSWVLGSWSLFYTMPLYWTEAVSSSYSEIFIQQLIGADISSPIRPRNLDSIEINWRKTDNVITLGPRNL